MRTLVVYDSVYGNTEKIARAIADACRQFGEVRLEAADALQGVALQGEDFIFIGGPTHKQNLSPAMQKLVADTPPRALRGVHAAAFDTRYEMPAWLIILSGGTAARKLSSRLRSLGAQTVSPPESFLIERDHQGPLQPGQIERAAAWARSVLAEISRRRRPSRDSAVRQLSG